MTAHLAMPSFFLRSLSGPGYITSVPALSEVQPTGTHRDSRTPAATYEHMCSLMRQMSRLIIQGKELGGGKGMAVSVALFFSQDKRHCLWSQKGKDSPNPITVSTFCRGDSSDWSTLLQPLPTQRAKTDFFCQLSNGPTASHCNPVCPCHFQPWSSADLSNREI